MSRRLGNGLQGSKVQSIAHSSVVDPNILNFDLDPEFWPKLDPKPDPDPGLCYQR